MTNHGRDMLELYENELEALELARAIGEIPEWQIAQRERPAIISRSLP